MSPSCIRLSAAALAAASLLACQSAVDTGKKVVGGLTEGLPGRGATVRVQEMHERFGYLDALLVAGERGERLLFPPDEACRALVATGAELRLTREGSFGRVSADDGSCGAVGSFALERMRNAGGRSPLTARPRAQAVYRLVDADESFYALRGRFPLAGLAGVPGGADLVALIPRHAACDPLAEQQQASLDFRDHGPPLLLIGPTGPCPIAALALPLSAGEDAEPPATDAQEAPRSSAAESRSWMSSRLRPRVSGA